MNEKSRSLYDVWIASCKIPAHDSRVLATADDASGIELQLEYPGYGLLGYEGLSSCICIHRRVCVSIVVVIVMMMMLMVVMVRLLSWRSLELILLGGLGKLLLLLLRLLLL